jgi:hypothetical protein
MHVSAYAQGSSWHRAAQLIGEPLLAELPLIDRPHTVDR